MTEPIATPFTGSARVPACERRRLAAALGKSSEAREPNHPLNFQLSTLNPT